MQKFDIKTLSILLFFCFYIGLIQIKGQQYDDREQNYKVDSLKAMLSKEQTDSAKLEIIRQIGQHYRNEAKLDSSIFYYQQALEFVQKNDFPIIYEVWQLSTLNHLTIITCNYSMALKYATRTLRLSEKINDQGQIAFALSTIAAAYAGMEDYRKTLEYFFQAKKAFETYESGHWAIQNIAETYLKLHKLDSALYYNQKAYYIADTGHNQQYMKNFAIRVFASIYAEKGDDQLAMKYYRQFVEDFYKHKLNNREIDRAYFGIANIHRKSNEIDSCIFYAKRALDAAKTYNDQEYILAAANLLYSSYDSLDNEREAFNYFKIAVAAKDSIASVEKVREIQNLAFNEHIREKEKREAEAQLLERRRRIIIISGAIGLIISFLTWNRMRQLRLKYKMMMEQRELEKVKARYKKELLELEAMALRAQMNPHFIFNSLNSIKALINKNENDVAAGYLTIFSKLIRTLFQNSDKREVSLFEEIETCKLYTQLEKMRFGDKVEFVFNVDETIDLKDIKVPALILQPFIENAIWHGLVPKETGGRIVFSVLKNDGAVECIIDDDGIGREQSKQFKPQYEATHQSKGIGMTQSRLELDKLLNEREDAIFIIDKEDKRGQPEGTKVIISFKENGN